MDAPPTAAVPMPEPTAARPPAELDHAAAARWLTGHLPPDRHRRLEPLGEGDFCVAFREGPRVVRVARHTEAAEALRAEACVLAAIADFLPLPVPRTALHAPAGGPVFTEHEEIRGDVLTRELWLGLPAPQRERIAAQLAEFLRELHALPTIVGRRCGLPRLDARRWARELLVQAPERLGPHLRAADRRRLVELLERCTGDDAHGAAPGVLIHRDVAPGHVLYDPVAGRLTGVIDFGDVAVGDAARDFVYIYEDFGAELLTAVLARYGRETAATILPRIRLWYLLEAAAWTLQMQEQRREGEWREGLRALRLELATAGPTGS